MKDWKPGTKVRFNIPDGANAEIIKYVGEFYWKIRTIPEGRELLAHQDDLKEGFRNAGEE